VRTNVSLLRSRSCIDSFCDTSLEWVLVFLFFCLGSFVVYGRCPCGLLSVFDALHSNVIYKGFHSKMRLGFGATVFWGRRDVALR